MLWSLIKIVFFVALVALVAFGGMILMDSEGSMDIAFMGFKVSLSPIKVVIALVVLLVAAWLILKIAGLCVALVKFLLGDETAISRYFDRNRERKGFEAMAEGLMALASGEGRVAMSKASKAEKYLRKPELTNLLIAQAAEMTGDRRKAQDVYRRLVKDDRTRFVGVRGIMKHKLEEGDTETALKLAEKAFALKPKHVETQDTLLGLQAGKSDWAAARTTLSAKLKHGAIPRDVHKRRDAVLALSEAKGVFEAGATVEAREAAIEANKKSPDLIPAAVLASDEYVRQGKPRPAARILKKAWDSQPHPDLAAAFARIVPDETPKARLKRFAGLVRAKPGHPETKMLLAELNIAAEDFPEARRMLGDLVKSDPTARSMTLMAAIERGEGADDVVVRGWLTQALTASHGPQWVCDKCQTVHPAWAPICDNCAAFDTLSWRTPAHSEVSMPAGTEMLPMIVGADAVLTNDAEVAHDIDQEAANVDIVEVVAEDVDPIEKPEKP
ncbi:HemY protein [Pacificibacter maritimus]|uniref:HemY protein n=1 Tax=Pacificibacter maritimus TaxID=762213 RepID=A0A3N4U2M9_9RHOB|nr:heme biosynthesis HemY N-terminal domain-containing protein [Pacificibacter maritimus]RPE64752.1 HemY protein [Pacificibacter maritimus]